MYSPHQSYPKWNRNYQDNVYASQLNLQILSFFASWLPLYPANSTVGYSICQFNSLERTLSRSRGVLANVQLESWHVAGLEQLHGQQIGHQPTEWPMMGAAESCGLIKPAGTVDVQPPQVSKYGIIGLKPSRYREEFREVTASLWFFFYSP